MSILDQLEAFYRSDTDAIITLDDGAVIRADVDDVDFGRNDDRGVTVYVRQVLSEDSPAWQKAADQRLLMWIPERDIKSVIAA